MTNNSQTPSQLLFTKLAINLDEVPIEQLSHYIAIKYYLTVEDDPPPDATNLEKVRRYLETFHHLCEVEDWDKAVLVSSFSMGNNNNLIQYNLFRQLEIWGYYSEQIQIYTNILNKERVPANLKILAFLGLGKVYRHLADYHRAISFSQKALALSQKISDSEGIVNALDNLGIAYVDSADFKRVGLANFKRAIDCFQESLVISINAELFPEQAKCLGNLGYVYGKKNKFSKAIYYLEESLSIANQIGDRILQAKALQNLGNCYVYKRDYQKAIGYFEQSLSISKEYDNRSGEMHSLNSLGELYRRTKQYNQAVDCLEKSLAITREIKEPVGEENALISLGSVYGDIGNYQQAITYQKQALIIARKINDREGILFAQLNLWIANFLKFSNFWRKSNSN
ncbi:MAG: tetratricopeptide repeat protein [Nostoc sp. EkiNYC01]|nr:tetratricopeptide repeat protein [Nostoc sp. EkiNYC01]